MLEDGVGRKDDDEIEMRLFADERKENSRYARWAGTKATGNEQDQMRKMSKCEEQERDHSICLSIEKNLPNVNVKAIIEEFQKEIRMKNRAVDLAEALIKKITEQNQELRRKIQQLNQAICRKDIEIQKLNLQLKQDFKCGKFCKRTNRTNSMQEQRLSPTNNSLQKREGRHSDLKIINIDHPQYKDLTLSKLNVSKKLVPINYSNASIRSSHTLNSYQTPFECTGLLQQMAILMVRDEIDASNNFVKDINDMLEQQDIAYSEMCDSINTKSQDINQEIYTSNYTQQSNSNSNPIQKRLFAEPAEDRESQSILCLIKNYENCVSSYRQYCNLMRSLLCECINYVAQNMSIELPPSFLDPAFLTHLLKVVTRDVKERIFVKTKDLLQLRNDLKQQNQELKQLIEEMIRHYQKSKSQEHYDESINYKGMKQLQ